MKPYTLMQLKQTTTPEQFSAHLREMGEIFWWEPGKFFVITSYHLAKQILTSPDFTCDRTPFFISRMPEMNLSLIADFFKVVSLMMVMSDAPEHTDRRRICYHGFSNQCLEQLKPLIQRTVAKCLTELIENKSFDFVSQLAQIIPSVTLAELFAIPDNERLDFYHWSNNMTQFFGGSTRYQDEDGIMVNHSAQQLYNYFSHLIGERRHQPGQDFLSVLLEHQAHFGLTDNEIISQAIMMLVAGQVTTTDQLCNNLFLLLNTPGLWQEVRTRLDMLDAYIEECNRLDPAVTFIFRVTKNDTVLGGQHIEKGKVIFISTHAINRDPLYFKQPDKIILAEKQTQHFSYGYGSHFCLGAKLARIEMHSIFKTLVTQFPSLCLDASKPPQRKHHSLSFSGFEHMYLNTRQEGNQHT
ncbi:cytochrome P450 [Fluoribacter dumoffii]|uniref:Cytochrome P450 107B1 n=1 Tax=Fluoribacter dumoffii TaxID=463 RepID=A0A377G5H0_9GAMM|nr:cytochrome P450 [Fluoribacter dumoffii]KTC91568.1 Cytochrome P450 [Fluoribacter dumoffii NY 23]MCW8387308.1 cytochrome P450 [Fluoribacter dumoffii]MCW8417186.1 cytochrome P450 [Fluoribacter dumoffii]MCW8454974.1 cytochrome P450 [Fluoribacter dumoffii]MCW8460949.1 cytochrome P450 [Fluoribacter dumoffii]